MDWLEEIEAQMDSTVPYYVPRLIQEIRRLRQAQDWRTSDSPEAAAERAKFEKEQGQ